MLFVDDIGTIHCKFSDGRQLGLIFREDMFHKTEPLLLIGHCISGNRRLHSVMEVAEFIMRHGSEGDVSITYENNRPLLDTCGIYLNHITDMEYREELLKVLIPMQIAVDESEEIDEDESQQFGITM